MSENKRSTLNKTGLFSLLAFVLVIIAMGAMYWCMARLDNRLLHLVNGLQTREQSLQKEISDLQANAVAGQKLQADVLGMQQAINQINQFQQMKETAWTVAEARYLIKIANDNLKYTGNIGLALKLLELADQTLVGLSDPKVVAVRQALAADIAHLQSVPQIDVDGIYARLAALHSEIDQLPLIDQPAKPAPTEQKTAADLQPWWQRGLQTTWDTLKTLVVVRYNEKGNLPLLPEQKIILYQNLHAQVAQAIWGLLHGEQDIYLSSLAQIQTWTKQYFLADNMMTQAVLTQLTNLQNLYIRPASPTITALEAIQKV